MLSKDIDYHGRAPSSLMNRLSPETRLALLMAGVSLATKLPIIGFGLPLEFNPDEAYILKEPFKLTYLYLHGVFAYPTNLFFWIVQGWYTLLFGLGRLAGHWHGVAEFRAALVAEAPGLLLWGRFLGALCAVAAVFLLARTVAQTIVDRRLRWLVAAGLALNPVDLVGTSWLKFDGMVALLNAVLVAALVHYKLTNDERDRRRLYVLAILAYSLRVDFIVFAGVILFHDVVRRRPLRAVLKPSLAGIGLYSIATLAPVVFLYRWIAPDQASRAMNVTGTFEGHILNRLAADWRSGALWGTPRAALAFYLPILLCVGLPFLIIAAKGVARSPAARLMVLLSAATIGPMLISSAVATRYALPLSVYLFLGAAWAIDGLKHRTLRFALGLGLFLVAGSLTLESITAIRSGPDPRAEAGAYVLAHTTASDIVAVEDYINPGRHAEIPECANELRKKAEATVQTNTGTGETFSAWAALAPSDCRRVLEVTDTDRFARSTYAGRWINTYDAGAFQRASPALFTTNVEYASPAVEARHPEFARFVRVNYDLVRVFEPRYADPRVRRLLVGTPYYATLYVYQRRF